MTMNDIIYMIFVFIAGFTLGTLFFGGLWFTVKKAMTAKIPAIWFFTSFFLRVSMALLGFYYLALEGWQSIIISIIGFIAARIVITQLTESMAQKQAKREVWHEA